MESEAETAADQEASREAEAELMWSSRAIQVHRLLKYLQTKRGIAKMSKALGKPATKKSFTKITPPQFFKLCLDLQQNGTQYVKDNVPVEDMCKTLGKKLKFEIAPLALKRAQQATGHIWGQPLGPKKRLEALTAKATQLGYSSIEEALSLLEKTGTEG